MPLPPLLPDNTERFKVTYSNQTVQHTATVRTDTVSPSGFGTYFDALMSALSAVLAGTTIDRVEYAPTGTTFFVPVTSGIEGNTYGGGGGSVVGAPENIGFVGRSSGARRSRLFIYGINALGAVDYRFQPGELSEADAAIAVLNAATNCFLAIDGIKPVWYSYANAGVNAHWQRAVRP